MRVFLPASIALVCLGANPGAAQTYPAKPIHIVVPSAPGGVTDLLARSLAVKLTQAWGQQVVIENKPGANNQIGAEFVAKAAPDGYTLLVTPETTFVVNPSLYGKLAYDAEYREKVLLPNTLHPIAGSPDQYAALIRTDTEKWTKVIRDARIKVE